ncbi:MAG: hypothetical protein Q9182_001389 [Xanthomendoza sp. 2 TL-2023]
MFHRRRASSNPPVKTPPTAAASTAAVQAFLASRTSNNHLSNAAAAAALRSRPTTPTPVGELPTKRRAQRSSSISSNGSARPTLSRQNSGSSMTERTFRDPSPRRGNLEPLHSDNPPPVPALPKGYASLPPLPAKSLRRPASVEPPERITSPIPRAGGRGVSLDREAGIMQPKKPKKMKAPNLGTVGEVNRVQNRESINFSRPMSPQNSPPTSPLRELKAYPGLTLPQTQTPTANMGVLRDGEADNIQYAVQNSATRPVKKKKKAVAKELVEGSHFAKGRGAQPTGTALDTPKRSSLSTSSTPSPSEATNASDKTTAGSPTVPKKKKKRVVSSESSQGSHASDSDSSMSNQTGSTDRPRAFNTRVAGLLAKQPSIVREDREAEEKEDYGRLTKQTDPNGSRSKDALIAPTSATSKQHKKSASQPQNASVALERSTALDVPALPGETFPATNANGLATKQQRPQSLSPGRAAHFLPQPMYETPDGIKHQPPARSVSPAKSALKHSPSSRGASPVGFPAGGFTRLPGAAGSEASDNGSVVSDDGGRLQPAKKKRARVSFDEAPISVGQASTPPALESPTILSPQHKDSARKGFLGFGRHKDAGGLNNSDQEDVMKPTPTLPSFGSIRGRKQGDSDSLPDRPDGRRSTQTMSPEMQSSSDQVVGHVLSQDFESRKTASTDPVSNQKAKKDPLPPEVTSVEGSGYHSDDEDDIHGAVQGVEEPSESTSGLPYSQQPDLAVQHMETPMPSASDSPNQGENQSSITQNGLVPTIAILPATPGIGSNDNEPEDWFRMPGGFSPSVENQGDQADPARRDTSSVQTALHYATEPTPAKLGISEPEPETTTTSVAGSPIVGHVAESIQHQTEVHKEEESDDSGNSIYSDAAEDISDLEGDGFGSINAIMESPVVPRTPFVASLVPESPPAQIPRPSAKTARPSAVSRHESELSEPSVEEGWDQAQAYWSGLSQSRKEQLERAAQRDEDSKSSAQIDAATTRTPGPAIAPLNKSQKKKTVKKTTQSAEPPLPPWPDREFREEVTRPASPKDGKIKQSMKSTQPDGPQTHMRSSMRNGVPLKSSMRNAVQIPGPEPVPRGGLTKKTRPVSAIAVADYEKANGKVKPAASHGRASSVGVSPKPAAPVAPIPKKVVKPALRRVASNGSDSSSSFKKSRPSTSDGGKYSMKRTMRGPPTDGRPQSASANKPASMSVRSTSPAARRPFSTAGSGMRTSMRDSMDSGLGSRTKSPSRGFGFGRKAEPKAASRKTGSKFSSRFGDSSDEDEAPVKRHSRFIDSSDEEDNAGLTPVRGIPRRIDEGDSTDLEDSSASPSPAIKARDEKPSVSTAKPLEGSALATGSLRTDQTHQPAETGKKKRSFFSGLGGSRKQSQPPPTTTPSPPANTFHPLEANYASPKSPSSPKSPKAATILGTSATSSPNPSQSSPKPPKLQRRNTPKRFASDSWPLPENSNTSSPAAKMKDSEKLRPSTSDGAGAGRSLVMGTMRPEVGGRRFTADEKPVGVNGAIGAGAGAGGKEIKKKRFPMLRKALGIKSSD